MKKNQNSYFIYSPFDIDFQILDFVNKYIFEEYIVKKYEKLT